MALRSPALLGNSFGCQIIIDLAARYPERTVGTYDKDAGTNNQRLYLNGTRVAQMSDTLPIDLNSAALGIGRHVSGIADPFNGHIDEFRIAHVQRSDGWSGDISRQVPRLPEHP